MRPTPHAFFLTYSADDAEAARRICSTLRAFFENANPLLPLIKSDPRYDQPINRVARL